MKVNIHTLRYYPSIKPQCRLVVDLVSELIKRGNQVTVFTAKNSQSCKSLHGEQIVYVNNLGRLSEQPLRKLLDYISFNIQSTIKSFFLHLQKGCYIDIFLSGPGFISFVVMLATKLFRFKTVFWVLDRYPDVLFKNKILRGQMLFKILKRIEIFFLNRITFLIFETNIDMKDYYIHKGTSNSTLVRTWGQDTNGIKYKQPDFWGKEELYNKDVLVYSGNFGFSQPINEFPSFLREHRNMVLVLLGDGSQKENIARSLIETENIVFHDFLPDAEYAYVLKNSKYGVISLRKDLEGFSSKMTTYLAHDLPILAFIGRNNDMAEIIDKYYCGIIINSDIYKNIKTSGTEYEKMKNNAMKAKEIFNKEINVNKFITTLESIVKTNK